MQDNMNVHSLVSRRMRGSPQVFLGNLEAIYSVTLTSVCHAIDHCPSKPGNDDEEAMKSQSQITSDRKSEKIDLLELTVLRHWGGKSLCNSTGYILQTLSCTQAKLRHVIFTLYTQVFQKSISVYENVKDQMKLDLCICEALSYTSVSWKPHLWAWLSITTNTN